MMKGILLINMYNPRGHLDVFKMQDWCLFY